MVSLDLKYTILSEVFKRNLLSHRKQCIQYVLNFTTKVVQSHRWDLNFFRIQVYECRDTIERCNQFLKLAPNIQILNQFFDEMSTINSQVVQPIVLIFPII